ncbi:MAG: zinc-binding dehydrogenase [Clostridia bacterium]|nr:zinc-binding dehydrogenase [Clostridia bacterium]
MKIWQLASPKNLQRSTAPDLKISENTAKVKVMKALLSEADVASYAGSLKTKYPLVLGRYALGQITEAGESSFMKKGDRVYLAHSFEDELSPDGTQTAGQTVDGYYRDFVLVDENQAYVLPPSVSDEAAFLIDAVALAERVVEEMDLKIGQHILVMGGGLYGNVLCQILIYHRAVPILVDNNQERLSRAKKCGIYYTLPFDETLKENIMKVTGGKCADGAIYLAFNNRIEPSSVFNFLAKNTTATFCSLLEKPLTVNLENALKNNITVKGITECREHISSAINILANKAVSFSEFPYFTYQEEALPEKMKEYAEILSSGGSLPEQLDVFRFIF